MAQSIRREGYLHERYHYFHLRDSMGQERDFHFHDFDKLVIHLSGQAEYLVEDRVYPLRPWDVLLIRHHTIHRANISREIPYERIIIYLDELYFTQSFPDVSLTACFEAADEGGRHRITPDPAMRRQIKELLDKLEYGLQDQDFGAEILCDTYLIQLLVLLSRAFTTARRSAAVPSESRRDRKISPVLSYIQEHLDQAMSVEELAAMAHLSPYYFMRLFKAETGYSVHGYIQQNRLIRAAKLIRGGVPVSEAALSSGFLDYSAFYRAFRKQFGASPSQLKGLSTTAPGTGTLRDGSD